LHPYTHGTGSTHDYAAADAASVGAGVADCGACSTVVALTPFGVGPEVAGVASAADGVADGGFGLLNVTVLLYRLTLATAARRALSNAGLSLTVGSVVFNPRWNSPGSVVRPGGCWNVQFARVQFAPNLQGIDTAVLGMKGLAYGLKVGFAYDV